MTDSSATGKRERLQEMSFLEHLEDLRGVLIQSTIVCVALMMVLWFFSGSILDLLVGDLPVENLNFFAPTEAFMARIKISLVLALMIAFPFILYRVWSFVSPALFDRERRRVYPFLLASSALFYAGVLFCYLVLIPVVLEFLLGFGTKHVSPLISVSSYFAFVARLCFTFGLVFQLPVIVFVLSMIGIVSPQFLLRQWRYAVLTIFVVAAVLTPPDPASQILMAVPVLGLYLVSVLTAYVVFRKRERSDEDPWEHIDKEDV